MSQLTDLEQQLQATEDAISQEPESNVEALQMLNGERNNLLNRIAEIKAQQTLETTANEIASSMETYNIGDSSFTLDQLAADDDAAKILRKGIAENSQKQAQKWLEELNTQKAVYEQKLLDKDKVIEQKELAIQQKDSVLDTLQGDIDVLHIENSNLQDKVESLTIEDAVKTQEIARLNSHVDDLRKEIAIGATNATNVIDITSSEELEAAAQRLKAKQEAEALEKKAAAEAAKVRIYNVQPLDGTGANFGANRVDNDEYITFGWLERKQYVELSNEEAQRFREEAAKAAQAELESIPSNDEPTEQIAPPELQFRNEAEDAVQNDNAGDELVGDKSLSEGTADHDGEPKSIEQILTEHRKRLEALEQAVFGKEKAAA